MHAGSSAYAAVSPVFCVCLGSLYGLILCLMGYTGGFGDVRYHTVRFDVRV